MVFHWASGKFAKPISMSIEDYYAIQNKMAEKRPALTPQKAPVPQQETTQAFDWQDPLCWHNVKFKEKGEVLFSHRLNLEKLTPEQEKEAKEGLEKHNIHFEERQATSDSGDIKQGDRTLRISDKESIEKLRTFVFHWAQGAGARPVSLSVEEYNAQEIQRQAALTGAQGGRK